MLWNCLVVCMVLCLLQGRCKMRAAFYLLLGRQKKSKSKCLKSKHSCTVLPRVKEQLLPSIFINFLALIFSSGQAWEETEMLIMRAPLCPLVSRPRWAFARPESTGTLSQDSAEMKFTLLAEGLPLQTAKLFQLKHHWCKLDLLKARSLLRVTKQRGPHLPSGAAPQACSLPDHEWLLWKVENMWPGDDGCLMSFRWLVRWCSFSRMKLADLLHW